MKNKLHTNPPTGISFCSAACMLITVSFMPAGSASAADNGSWAEDYGAQSNTYAVPKKRGARRSRAVLRPSQRSPSPQPRPAAPSPSHRQRNPGDG